MRRKTEERMDPRPGGGRTNLKPGPSRIRGKKKDGTLLSLAEKKKKLIYVNRTKNSKKTIRTHWKTSTCKLERKKVQLQREYKFSRALEREGG